MPKGGGKGKKRVRSVPSSSCSEADEGVGASSPAAQKQRASPDKTRKPAQDEEVKKRRESVAREQLMRAATLSAGLTATVRRDDGKYPTVHVVCQRGVLLSLILT